MARFTAEAFGSLGTRTSGVHDTDAKDPMTVDPYIVPSAAPVATFSGSSANAFLGESLATSTDGQVALVSSSGAGSYIYDESGGTWSTTPVVTFPGNRAVALSADGRTALVGDGSTFDVYEAPGGSWSTTPVASFTDSWASSGALSADGQVALIGAPSSGSYDGAAYVYEQVGGSWSTTPALTLTGTGGAELGYSVALSSDGQTALVGAPDAGSQDEMMPHMGGPGAVYAYGETSGSWSTTPTATFTGSSDEDLGSSVALSADGETALLDAPCSPGCGPLFGDGAAYVYDESAMGWSMTPSATFTASTEEELGNAVALSADGQTALLGAPDAGPLAGAAYVYTRTGSTWPASPAASFIGTIPGGTCAVRQRPGRPGGRPERRAGRRERDWDRGGLQLTRARLVRGPDGHLYWHCGHDLYPGSSAALSADGQAALIGAQGFDGPGSASLYTEGGNGWASTYTPEFTWDGSGSGFGGQVGLSADGRTVLVTDPSAGSSEGAAYLYSDPGTGWSATPVANFAGSATAEIGAAAALSANGHTVLFGAEGSSSGSAYVYSAGAVTAEVSGSQSYGSSAPAFNYTANAPVGVEVTGTVSCSTVDGGSPIGASLGEGSHTVDGSSCSGLTLTGPNALSYAISYAGDSGGFVVSADSAPVGGGDGAPPVGGGGPPPVGLSLAPQVIDFTAPASGRVGGSATLVATGGPSGNPVVFSVYAASAPGICAISGTNGATVSFTGRGDCIIDANQAGNAEYSAAPQVERTIAVTTTKSDQTISFGALVNKTLAQSPVTLHATASSGLPVSFTSTTLSVCGTSGPDGARLSLRHTGECTVRASQTGNSSYDAAVPVSRTLSVSKDGQKITFAPLTKKTLTGSPFSLKATASSGLAVSFTAVPPSVCTTRTIGGRAKITLLKAGTCTVRASQAGNATYDPATPVSRSFKVSEGS